MTGAIVLLCETKWPKAIPHVIISSFLLQAVFEIVLETNYDESHKVNSDQEFTEDQIMSFALVRPLNQAVLILYILTQGLTFKQVFYLMLPIYAILEIGRSLSFIALHSLDLF